VARNVVEATVRASAPRHTVWDVLADLRSWQEWGDWQSTGLEREGHPAPNGPGAVRRMVRRPLTIREQVELLETPSRFGYTLLSGLPLRDYHALVTLTDAGDDCTNIHWESRFDARWRVLDAPMRKLVRATLDDVARKLAAEAERRS